ncbi:protein of unknown function [Nitrospina watsonii]|uniref:Uncharacterized protein n=1 Tax=Nitrospina watsonii TaxID=1323948 RepID=A0ABN8VY80_9BACT|nr:protein of unknown function [Nitrospina watsonii]
MTLHLPGYSSYLPSFPRRGSRGGNEATFLDKGRDYKEDLVKFDVYPGMGRTGAFLYSQYSNFRFRAVAVDGMMWPRTSTPTPS